MDHKPGQSPAPHGAEHAGDVSDESLEDVVGGVGSGVEVVVASQGTPGTGVMFGPYLDSATEQMRNQI